MKTRPVKILLVFLISLSLGTSAYCNFFPQGEKHNYPDNNRKEIIYTLLNVGRIIGNTVFTIDSDVELNKPAAPISRIASVNRRYSDSDKMAIGFGIIALVFLIMNMYFGGKIVEFLKARGRKAHYFALRWMIFSYVNQYKAITTEEDGQAGPYYKPIGISALLFATSIILAVIFSVIS